MLELVMQDTPTETLDGIEGHQHCTVLATRFVD